MEALFFISMRSPFSERLDRLRSLGPHPHDESGHFLTAFFTRIRVDRVLNHSGARFQKDAFSVGGFTGFKEGRGGRALSDFMHSSIVSEPESHYCGH